MEVLYEVIPPYFCKIPSIYTLVTMVLTGIIPGIITKSVAGTLKYSMNLRFL